MARTQRVSRCKNPRTHGSFCRKHVEECQSQKYISKLFERMPSSEAMAAWERSQVELAMQKSLEEDVAFKKQEEKSLKRIDKRLSALKLKRVPMPRLGACQFESLVHAAQLPMSPLQLRLQAIDYLESLGHMFQDRLEAKFKGQYNAYLSHMRCADSWGDELTLMACSHLLRREISVITDSSEASNHTLTFSPPEIISEDLWKERLTICCLLGRHYDSTAAA